MMWILSITDIRMIKMEENQNLNHIVQQRVSAVGHYVGLIDQLAGQWRLVVEEFP